LTNVKFFLVRLTNKTVGLFVAPFSEKVENHWCNQCSKLSVTFCYMLVRFHRSTCRFARGEDDCGNVQVDRQTSLPSNFAQVYLKLSLRCSSLVTVQPFFSA